MPQKELALDTVRYCEIGTGISEFLLFPMVSEEASKWVPMINRGTRSKPTEAQIRLVQIDLV